MTMNPPAARAQAILLLAHGARDPQWAEPFRAVAAQVAQGRPDASVHLAFLEFMAPALPEAAEQALAEGATDLHVVPLFLGTGGHVRKDVPPMLEALRAAHPGATLTLHPAIGATPAVISAMAGAALACASAVPAGG